MIRLDQQLVARVDCKVGICWNNLHHFRRKNPCNCRCWPCQAASSIFTWGPAVFRAQIHGIHLARSTFSQSFAKSRWFKWSPCRKAARFEILKCKKITWAKQMEPASWDFDIPSCDIPPRPPTKITRITTIRISLFAESPILRCWHC